MRIATRVSSSGGSIDTINPEPKREIKRSSTPQLLGETVSCNNDLTLTLQQSVKSMKKLFLRTLLTDEELNVVY